MNKTKEKFLKALKEKLEANKDKLGAQPAGIVDMPADPDITDDDVQGVFDEVFGADNMKVLPPTDDLNGLLKVLSDALGGLGGGSKQARDTTPVSSEVTDAAIKVIADSTTALMPKVVDTFCIGLYVHEDCHKADKYPVNLHGTVCDTLEAVEAIAEIRFGKVVFHDAVKVRLKELRKTADEAILNSNFPGHAFHTIRRNGATVN